MLEAYLTLLALAVSAFALFWAPLIYLLWRFRPTPKPLFALLQMAVLCVIAGLLLQDEVWFLLSLYWPVAGLTVAADLARLFEVGLGGAFVLWGLPALVICLALLTRAPRTAQRFAMSLCLCAGVISGSIGANFAMQSQIRTAARDAGAACLSTANIWRAALTYNSIEWPTYANATAFFDGRYHIWSFSEARFIATSQPRNGDHVPNCASRGLRPRSI